MTTDRLMFYLEKGHKLSPNQSGFRGRGTKLGQSERRFMKRLWPLSSVKRRQGVMERGIDAETGKHAGRRENA